MDRAEQSSSLPPAPLPPRARRGRPAALSDAERRARILDGLDEIFARSGMDGLSMNAVARHAGMSKRTLYTIFADRTALFLAYLERLKAGHIRPLGPGDEDEPLETRLRRLLGPVPVGTGLQLPLSILRAIVAEVPARPEVGVRLLDSACLETAALIRMAELGVRLPVLQDGRRDIAAALSVPNVMPATVVLRRDGSVAAVLPRPFTSADEIAAAVESALR